MVNKGGRPKNIATVCTVCGKVLTNENTRETRPGSGRLRSKCNECANMTKTAKKAAAARRAIASQQDLMFTNGVVRIQIRRLNWLVPKKGVKYVDRDEVWVAPVSREGARVMQVIQVGFKPNGKPRYREVPVYCDECGAELRYLWKTLEKVCTNCRLIDSSSPGAINQFTIPARLTSRHVKLMMAKDQSEIITDDESAMDFIYALAYSTNTGKSASSGPIYGEAEEDTVAAKKANAKSSAPPVVTRVCREKNPDTGAKEVIFRHFDRAEEALRLECIREGIPIPYGPCNEVEWRDAAKRAAIKMVLADKPIWLTATIH